MTGTEHSKSRENSVVPSVVSGSIVNIMLNITADLLDKRNQ